MNETFTSKLGKTRAGPRSRIWIEGKRVAAAGFTPMMKYWAVWTPATLTLFTSPYNEHSYAEERKVSGKGDKPIIDIVGVRVNDTFGAGTHVRVSYGDGVITIRKA